MSSKTKFVGFWWDTKGCTHHAHKNFWEWRYDDALRSNVHINLGIMAADDFGNMFVIGGVAP